VAKEQEQRLILTQQAKAHPLVKQALEMFGGELAEVRTTASGAGGTGMKSPFGNMSNILKQAQAMQEQMAKSAGTGRE
jgi:hypothetical protein